jgi:hypothetical protein
LEHPAPWQGTLQAGTATSLSFFVRESEIASTIKTPGAQGALIIAIETRTSDPNASLRLDAGGGIVLYLAASQPEHAEFVLALPYTRQALAGSGPAHSRTLLVVNSTGA